MFSHSKNKQREKYEKRTKGGHLKVEKGQMKKL